MSLPHTAEVTSILSEAEEIKTVKKLKSKGEKAFLKGDFKLASDKFNEALEIDENNVEIIYSRAACNVQLGLYREADEDLDKVLKVQKLNPKCYYLKGIINFHLDDYEKSLSYFTISLENGFQNIDSLSLSLANLVSKLVDDEVLLSLEAPARLAEVGCILAKSKYIQEAQAILEVANNLQVNSPTIGIRMRILLTLANLKAKLGDLTAAVEIYEHCEAVALSCHDENYQSKSLIGSASIFLELGFTHKAIVAYEKLADLEQDHDPKFVCALHLNLSLAYKAVGLLDKAKHHAKLYMVLAEKHGNIEEAKSHLNLGIICSLNGDLINALEHFKTYLRSCKRIPNQLSRGYSCLASVYASLNHPNLALVYLEQLEILLNFVSDTEKSDIYESLGDAYAQLKDVDKAVECYQMMSKKGRNSVISAYKIGKVYAENGKNERALFHLDRASSADFTKVEDMQDIMLACDVKSACILASSRSANDLDRARSLFSNIIPILESKIKQHQVERTFCPEELRMELNTCFACQLDVLNKLCSFEEALCSAELQRAQPSNPILPAMGIQWNFERIQRAVNLQKSTILFYTIRENEYYLWILQPRKGLVKFFSRKSYEKETMSTRLLNLINEIKNDGVKRNNSYTVENRSLPRKDADLTYIREQFGKLNEKKLTTESRKSSLITNRTSSIASEEFFRNELNSADILIQQTFPLSFTIDGKKVSYNSESDRKDSTSSCEILVEKKRLKKRKKKKKIDERIVKYAQVESELIVKSSLEHIRKEYEQLRKKPALRELYDLLISPIVYMLEDITSLVIIPESILYHVPWTFLENVKNERLGKKYNITLLPSLAFLERTIYSDLEIAAVKDELKWNRKKARDGGCIKHITKTAKRNLNDTLMASTPTMNLRQTSNPRLLTSRAGGRSGKQSLSRESTAISLVRSVLPIERITGINTLNTLTLKTHTNTDIVTSDVQIPEFKQISQQDKCHVIGCPKIGEVILYEKKMKLNSCTKAMQKECFAVSDLLAVKPWVGAEANRAMFFYCMRNSTILHISTLGCNSEGLLVFSPDPELTHEQPLQKNSYIVTTDDIASMPCNCSLVVLSSAWSERRRDEIEPNFNLACSFLSAGAQCVVTSLWPIPNEVLLLFYKEFYTVLLKGCLVSDAIRTASDKISKLEGFEGKSNWASFILLGKDAFVNLQEIKHCQLDQLIDKAEDKFKEEYNWDPLNPSPLTPTEKSREYILEELMNNLSSLLVRNDQQPEVLPHLVDLLDMSIKRLNNHMPISQTIMLNDNLASNVQALLILRSLGFRFQAKDGVLSEPFVVFPYNDNEVLLLPVYDALRACLDIRNSPKLCRALYELFPATQDSISHIIDLLAITKHSTDIQLYVTDATVAAVWRKPSARVVLSVMGFHQISSLLHFHATLKHKRLLNATLQLFISLSNGKSPLLLRKLDVNLLGGHHLRKHSPTNDICLPSLTPLILPRNQMRMATPWLSVLENSEEMKEKIKLAFRKKRLDVEYRETLSRAKTWHQTPLENNENSPTQRPMTSPSRSQKVKVLATSSQSHSRLPIDHKPLLTIPETEENRDYARYILDERQDEANKRFRIHTRKLLSPYAPNTNISPPV
ncbi:DgyrCDS4822 [Dimorphilus gyrociliatus]|uniref:DgyrCDS4822 n=1 Tax=Dimorphilus gyrociliatus TaxID=2664684 RepID=A0A7I8VKR4_9ANNE|nr:DgyrCDS4822 [Dimorphilus gyrociliatus]